MQVQVRLQVRVQGQGEREKGGVKRGVRREEGR
jgi:hypothetical protein